jgi:hypothetical protein
MIAMTTSNSIKVKAGGLTQTGFAEGNEAIRVSGVSR